MSIIKLKCAFNTAEIFLAEIKKIWVTVLITKFSNKGMTLLGDKVHEQEPQQMATTYIDFPT